ncbi:MAG: hypothetical protein R6U55_16185 [Desulfovermiculus sp.]
MLNRSKMMKARIDLLYAICCSPHFRNDFLRLLKLYGLTALADVRSHPYQKQGRKIAWRSRGERTVGC